MKLIVSEESLMMWNWVNKVYLSWFNILLKLKKYLWRAISFLFTKLKFNGAIINAADQLIFLLQWPCWPHAHNKLNERLFTAEWRRSRDYVRFEKEAVDSNFKQQHSQLGFIIKISSEISSRQKINKWFSRIFVHDFKWCKSWNNFWEILCWVLQRNLNRKSQKK